jgi:hypothetical protein
MNPVNGEEGNLLENKNFHFFCEIFAVQGPCMDFATTSTVADITARHQPRCFEQ